MNTVEDYLLGFIFMLFMTLLDYLTDNGDSSY